MAYEGKYRNGFSDLSMLRDGPTRKISYTGLLYLPEYTFSTPRRPLLDLRWPRWRTPTN